MNRILIKAPLESFAREAVGFSKAFWHFIWRSVLVLSVLFIGRQILIASLGDAVLGLPEFQMERFAGILSEPELFSSDVFVLGDSSAVFSVSAKDLPRTLSLASINSTPMEAFYSLKKILKEGAKPNCILFSGSFSWKANHEFFWPMFVANGFYASGDLKEIYEVSSLNGDPPGNIGRILFEWKSALYGRKIIDGISWGRIQDAIFQYQEKIKRARRFQANVQREKGSNPVLDHSSFEGRKDLVFSASPDRKSTRLNSSHSQQSRMPSSA